MSLNKIVKKSVKKADYNMTHQTTIQKRKKLEPFDSSNNEALPEWLVEMLEVEKVLNERNANHLKIAREKKLRTAQYFYNLVKRTKISTELKPIPPDRPLLPRKNLCHQHLRQYASEMPLGKMERRTRKCICRRLPKILVDRYPALINILFEEAEKDYSYMVKFTGLNQKVLPFSEECYQPEFRYKYEGRTANYNVYLRRRAFIKRHLFIIYPLLKIIHDNAVREFPEYLINLSIFRTTDPIQFGNLKSCILESLQDREISVINNFYSGIISKLRATKNIASTTKYLFEYLTAAGNLIGERILELLFRTINHIVNVVGDRKKTPYLRLNLYYNGKFEMFPAINEVHEFYHNIIIRVCEVAQEIPHLDYWLDLPYNFRKIKIEVPDYFKKWAHEELEERLKNLFAPVQEHLLELEEYYQELRGTNLINEIDLYIAENHSFEECCDKVKYFLEYQNKISTLLFNMHFDIGRLCQVDTIKSLRECVNTFISHLLNGLVLKNKHDNQKICDAFEQLAERAMQVPKNTEELMETGVYMLWARTTHMAELREQIEIALNHMTKLLEMTTLEAEHIKLNAVTINWLETIKPIFEAHNSMFEQRKFELEEDLQRCNQHLRDGIEDFLPYLLLLDDMSDCDNACDYKNHLREMILKIREFEKELSWINKEEALFKFPLSTFPELEECKNIIYPFYELIYLCYRWLRSYGVWMDGPWENLTFEVVEKMTDDYYKDFQKHQKTYRTLIRTQIAENYPKRFKGVVDDPDPNNAPAPIKLCTKAIEYIKAFKPNVSIVQIMCNPALTQRHWDEMSKIVNYDITPDAGTTLKKVINKDFGPYLDQFEIISVGAVKELQLQVTLAKMKTEWIDIKFKTSTWKETKISILSGIDDIQSVLDDHIIKTISMRGSAFVKPIENEVKDWYKTITRINSTIDEWGKVQIQWLYLLPIFSSKDIIAQMPEEGVLFQEVDAVYKRYMTAVERDPHVLSIAGSVGLLEEMQECAKKLDKINEGVAAYLEKKRFYFPRFFFLSNDEMLEILSETKDPLRVQPHLRKCFEGINRLEFDEDLVIHAMWSQEDEKINFVNTINTVEARGSVEKWLLQVEEQMLTSVRNEIVKSRLDYEKNARTTWVKLWPGQVVLCVSQIYWTIDAERCLRARSLGNLQDFHRSLVQQLNDIVTLVRSPQLTNLNRITIKALIVIDVHAKDVIQELLDNKIDNVTHFQWLAQLRYYWEEECLVRIINATVKYAYEYLGNSDRLVITPLTDRCYRTLIGAYYLHLNGAPEGPAGTGKTETTKDLAKAIAVQCVVFNCSDGLDYKAMGKFFKGLASSGAWACFDEFNRIELEVLSVVAQQILCIVLAVRAHLEKFIFEGTELVLNPACYICITMNPGYAGRSELPDNLKVLFRTVAMMVPDYAMIGEISLYSYGFVDARKLSIKIVSVYRLCSEQLSSQNHYDYGMRAVKTVLSACGNNKRKFPDENEDILLLRSIIDVNLPKFLSHDIPLFEGIISDLFPNLKLPELDYEVFIAAVKELCYVMNLQPKETFLEKIIQTYEMMLVRHGFMIVGEPFAGKTSALRVLADSLTLLNEQGYKQQKVHHQTINPKSITMGQLYGQFDPVSYEWTDGVIATCFRGFAMDPSPDRKWIIFDGPVDAVWIENMNTVLDDNKKLCLNSGEVIAMTNQMSMIFEVMDLAQASPATVSRCGMIYTEPITLGWQPVMQSWLKTANPIWCEANGQLIYEYFEWLVPPILYFIRKHCTQMVNAGVINAVKTCMLILEMLLDDACSEYPDDMKYMNYWVQASVLYSIAWGLGGTLTVDSRSKFDEFYRDLWKGQNEDIPIPECIGKIDIIIPSEGQLMDYMYHFKSKGNWKYWPDVVKGMKIEEKPVIQQIQIPTIDTARFLYLLDMFVRYKKPLLLMGPTGTGKSFYTQNMLMNNLSKDLYEANLITFTVKISANQTQELIISKLIKREKGVYGPPRGKTAVIFIDDMNMPVKEVYGAQPPIELLRQYFDHKHWYDLKNTSKIFLSDILFLSAMGPVGGSRQDVYARFLRHFSLFSINEFSDESMFKIFTNILLIGLKRNGFPTDIMMSIITIVNATIDIYKCSIANLLPTPAKSHYIFNLRDFARVIQGCSMIKKESAENKKIFVRLWVHETMRVFYDRLIDDNDRFWFFDKMRNIIKIQFKEHFDAIFDNLPLGPNDTVTEESLKDLLFGVCLDLDAAVEERRYEEIPSVETFLNVALACLQEYNALHKTKMDIVLFRYALEHLSKICRIISMPSGSGLLVGVSGSGRQTLTRLATAMCGYTLFQPEITKNYNMNEWRDDLKKVLKEAGGIGKDTVFLFTEGQIKEEGFLGDIDGLLNSGEVPNIYAIDEKQEILELTRLAAQGGNRALDVSPLEVFSFFVNRCKVKLHIILCFSPISPLFRDRLRLFPALVNCCTIDWFQDWPENALEMVAQRYVANINIPDEVKDASVLTCKYFHVSSRKTGQLFYEKFGRKTYMTSASYLDLIKCFEELIGQKQNELTLAKQRYLGGLDKLQFAAEQVATMQRDLNDLKPKLIIMAERSMEMARLIEEETKEAEIASNTVKEDEKVANVQAAAAQELKSECEADLALAIPILEEAIAALNTLKPADITLVKSMKNPPDAVKLVMAAVCVMRDIKPDRLPDPATGRKVLDFWGPSKRILGEMTFLQQLKDFDKDNIPVAVMAKIRKEYLPNKDFKPNIVAKASSAAEGLCKWVIAMDLYDNVAKEVAPKKAKLEIAESQYAATMAVLNEKRAMLAQLEARLAMLNQQLAEANEEMQRVQEEVTLCELKLIRAEKLIGGLGGEKTRWQEAAKSLQDAYDCLVGNVLISCGVIAYLAPFTTPYRLSCIDDWLKYIKNLNIPCSDQYDLRTILGTEIKIQNWYIAGLPNDTFSTDNAIIMDISKRWSLFIDPQGQANKWIKCMEKKNHIQVVKLTDSNYMKIVEHCVEFGQPVLIENVAEDLEAPLDPLLMKKVFVQGGMTYIALGDNTIPYHVKFRMYLTSNLRNPNYLPEIFNKVTIINFALTPEGLEDQLLGIVVAKERPDLQEKRQNLIIESAANKAALKDVEESILKTLSETKGNILEDEFAIQILDESKLISEDIVKKQKNAKETEIIIEEFRLQYKSMAEHSTILYYCVSELSSVDPMYQYSLLWFINLYESSIDNASKSKDINKRLKFLISTFTYDLYTNVCRSLFEKDKLLFSFVLYTKLALAHDTIDTAEFMFFLKGGTTVENDAPKPLEWLSNKSWDELCCLEKLSAFKGIIKSIQKHSEQWHHYYDLSEPFESKLPDSWDTKLKNFQKLVIIRVLCPDKIIVSIKKLIATEMEEKFVTPPPFDIARSYEDSQCLCPLIFILSPGSDPMAALVKFAERKGYDKKFKSISLGQGQGPIAQVMIEQAQVEEHWVCLQNCHLAVSWMSRLEKLCDNFDSSNTGPGFRLWLTSYPTVSFPRSILQNGVKMTNEAPTGLQQNLLRSYISEPVKEPDFYAGCPGKDKIFTKLLYGLCFFHAVIQERRTFGPIGWNIPYGFNESDFQISVQQLQIFINEYEEVPYLAISYLTGECNYGGRVTDDWDRRLIVTVLADFFNERVIKDDKYMFCDLASCYGLPRKLEHADVVEHIEGLPSLHQPEVFGLNKNAGLTRDLRDSMNLVDSAITVQGEIGASGGSGSDSHLLNMARDILSKLPQDFDIDKAQEKFPIEYSESMNTVLVQEMQRFNKLLREIRSSLQILEKAVQGLVVMSPSLDILANSLLLGKIPSSWMTFSYPSLKNLGSYVTDFLERIAFLQKWYEQGKPESFWLSGFYFTQAFLTGAKQNYARKYTIPIDQLVYDFKVLPTDKGGPAPADGVHIYGLFIEGARWDQKNMYLEEQKPKVLQELIPAIWFIPIKNDQYNERERYKSPLYKTLERRGILSTTGHSTNYVLPILLETKKPISHWIKRSVALFCQLD